MTNTQLSVLEFIVAYKQEHDGNSPSLRTIGRELFLSTTAVHHQIHKLIELGHLYLHGKDICVMGGQWIPSISTSTKTST